MKVLVIGNGGREHALVWKLAQSPLLTKLYCAPGNPGTSELATNVSLDIANLNAVAAWAKKEAIDLTVVGPEAPLAAGIVDVFEKEGLAIFGPSKAAAQMEASKSFAKDVILKADVPTPKSAVFEDFEAAKAYVEKHGAPIVIKADGLAAGKGVTVAATVEEAVGALQKAMCEKIFAESGAKVLIEDCIFGKEASVMAIVDGETVIPLVVSQDYKRLNDGDEGPNTGGMGAVSPNPLIPDETVGEYVANIFVPTLRELKKRGIHYRGFLYAGVMLDQQGQPYVIEYNCRLGDPETQVIMFRLESDLLAVLDAAIKGKLASVELKWRKAAAACVVASSRGYPEKVDDGKEIGGLFAGNKDKFIFQAGTAFSANKVVSRGGRVLAVTAIGKDADAALAAAYKGIEQISFDGMHYRKDIGSNLQ